MQLTGKVTHVIFPREGQPAPDNGFCVAVLSRDGGGGTCRISGPVPGIRTGMRLRMQGDWSVHPSYGESFRIVSSEEIVPKSTKGIEGFLASGVIPGVGKKTAAILVKAFGKETLDVIRDHPERLHEVEGIGEKKISQITEGYAAYRDREELMVFLKSYDVTTGVVNRIYRTYGKDSVAVIKENPYRLCSDVVGIGFRTADSLAASMGIDRESPFRMESGVLYALEQVSASGHVFVPRGELVSGAADLLGVSDGSAVERAIDSLTADRRLIEEDGNVYLSMYWHAERKVAEKLTQLGRICHPGLENADVSEASRGMGIDLDPVQEDAVRKALADHLMVITGGPGTGKTTIIKAIIRFLTQKGGRVLLAAPTGRAAKRLSEASGQEARTIHRLLEYGQGGFARGEDNPLDADALIVDECSMIDTLLMNSLLKAVPVSMRLILVGDVDQLPSVGAGNVLRDIIESGTVETIRLTKIFRQAMDSAIVTNAHRVNEGQLPVLSGNRDFFFVRCEPEAMRDTVVDLVTRRLPGFCGTAATDIQVLTPVHAGLAGTESLNTALRDAINPSGLSFKRGETEFREGDKVMQMHNDYDKNVFNGDIGTITEINTEDGKFTIDFGGEDIEYTREDLENVELAYAATVHKSQGSEYPVVVMPVSMSFYMMLQRNLLYTAITRAKKCCVLVGDEKAVAAMVRNNNARKRNSALKEKLQRCSREI